MTLPQLSAGHQVRLLQGGAEFFPALIQAIDLGMHEVRFETYIFNFDSSGEKVASALVRAALRGVRVYVVVDGAGTPEIPAAWVKRFEDAGLNWLRFAPLGRWGLLIPLRWRRLHRKLCVVDTQVAFCGGINVLDDLHDPNHGPLAAPRFDFSVRVTGPLVADVQNAMARLWARLQATQQLEHLRLREARKTWDDSTRAPPSPVGSTAVPGSRAALLLRDNLRNRTRIERAYRKAIADARHEVLIASAYFVPGHKLRRALIHAARRGVRVRLLLQGRYEYFMQYHAARPVYGALLAAGVEIHEYSISFLHAKVAVVDGHWATVGSSNLDPLSLLLAREANVVVDDAVFAGNLHTRLTAAMDAHGVRLDPNIYAGRPWRLKLLDRLAFGLMRLGIFLTGSRY